MNRTLNVILTICLALPACAQTPAILTDFNNALTTSMLAGQPELLSPFVNDTARLMPEFQMTVMNKVNVLQYYSSFARRFNVNSFSRTRSELLKLDDHWIIDWGLFETHLKHRDTGKEYELRGKYMDVWKRNSQGTLTLVTQAWNFNHQIDFGDLLRFSDVVTVNVAIGAHVTVQSRISFELAAYSELMRSTVQLHDSVRWSMFYADDGNFMYSNHPVYNGRRALNAFFKEHAAQLPIFENLDLRTDHIENLGKFVIEYSSHTAFVRGGNWSGTGTGKDLRVWRREQDGTLRIFRHIAMYD